MIFLLDILIWISRSIFLSSVYWYTEAIVAPQTYSNWIHYIHSLFTPIFKLVCMLSHFGCVHLFAATRMLAHQAPLTMRFSRQEYWSGLLFPPPEDLPDPGIEPSFPVSPALQADSLPLSHQGSHILVSELSNGCVWETDTETVCFLSTLWKAICII